MTENDEITTGGLNVSFFVPYNCEKSHVLEKINEPASEKCNKLLIKEHEYKRDIL